MLTQVIPNRPEILLAAVQILTQQTAYISLTELFSNW